MVRAEARSASSQMHGHCMRQTTEENKCRGEEMNEINNKKIVIIIIIGKMVE